MRVEVSIRNKPNCQRHVLAYDYRGFSHQICLLCGEMNPEEGSVTIEMVLDYLDFDDIERKHLQFLKDRDRND